MAGEGYGTTSIGTGSAQVVGSPSFDLTKLAQPLIQQQKEKVAKEAQNIKRSDKILGDLKGLGKIGSLRYGAAIDKFRGDVIQKAKTAIENKSIEALLDLENSKLQYNTILDLAKKNDTLNNSVGQQMLQGGNYWNKEYYDEYQKPLDISGIEKPEDLIGLMSKDADNMREIVKDKHNPMEFMTKMDGVAKTFYGTQGDFTEDDLKDSLTTLFTKDANSFDTYRHYEMAAKNDKALLEKNGGDVQKAALELAFNDFKPLVGQKPKSSKGDFNVNVNLGAEEGTGVSDVAPQTFDMNLENIGGQSPVTLSFDADGYSFTPVQASRAVPSNTFTLDGKPYTKQGIVNMAIGAVLDMPVANRDINVNGRTFKAGQPIPQEYVAFMNQEPNKYRNVVNFKKMATALVDDADQITFDLNEAENLIGTNQKWGREGYKKYKLNQTKMDTKGRYKELYPNLFGGTTQPTGGAKTTGGAKVKTSVFGK